MPAAASVFHLGDQAAQKASKSVRRSIDIDPDLLVIEHNFKIPAKRSRAGSKYDATFSKLKPGSAIKCEPGETGPLSHSLKKSIAMGYLPSLKGCTVRSFKRCDDGQARVAVVAPKTDE
jgi:hypothetical protein